MDRTPTARSAPQAPPYRPPTRLAFHATRIIIDVGFLIVLGSMSLPFVTSSVGNRSALVSDAGPTLLLLVPVFLVTLLPDHTRPIPMPLAWLSLVLGAAAFPYSIVKFLDAANVAETVGGSGALDARLLVLGTFVTLVGICVALARGVLNLPTGGAVPGPRPQPRPRASNPRGAGAAPPPRTPGGDRSARTERPQPTASPQTQRTAPQPDERGMQPPRSRPHPGAPRPGSAGAPGSTRPQDPPRGAPGPVDPEG